MKLWTRFALLAIFAGVLGGSVLSGCGKGGDDDSSNTATNTAKDKTPSGEDEAK